MSHHKRRMLRGGVLAAACLGMGLGADEPTTSQRAPAAQAKPDGERYLLLTDGRLLRGVISRDETSYSVTQRLGVIRLPRRQVEQAFDTVQEAYRYRLERVPEEDPAERLRLARWCLSLHLEAEARTLLEQVMEISPNHVIARSMLTQIQQSEANRAARGASKVDEGVQQTGGEEVHEDRAGALDSAVLGRAQQRMGITGLPVIFDLPPALAVQRAGVFKQYVHPILQGRCARCHNADYDGPFQLVPVRTSKQLTSDALRANLDATLRLIDRESPAKSELLSSTLRPHGHDGKHSIFTGSNDPAYQILATWVAGLRPTNGMASSGRPEGRMSRDSEEAFATGRPRPASEPLDDIARSAPGAVPRMTPSLKAPVPPANPGRSYRYVEGKGMLPEDPEQADPQEFPLPYAMGGARPSLPTRPASKADGRVPPASKKATAETVIPRPTRPAPVAVGVPPVADKARPSGNDAANPSVPKKSVKIDQKLLEKILQRNMSRQVDAP